jgi:hypothetical protein
LQEAGAPERGEHSKRFPVVVQDCAGLEEEVAGAALDGDSAGRGSLLQFALAGDRGGFVAAIPEDGFRSGLSRELEQSFGRGSAANDELGAALLQSVLQASQRVIQPPSRCGSGRPRRFLFRRPDEDGKNGRPRCDRTFQRGVIGYAQAGIEPDYGGGVVHQGWVEDSTMALGSSRLKGGCTGVWSFRAWGRLLTGDGLSSRLKAGRQPAAGLPTGPTTDATCRVCRACARRLFRPRRRRVPAHRCPEEALRRT